MRADYLGLDICGVERRVTKGAIRPPVAAPRFDVATGPLAAADFDAWLLSSVSRDARQALEETLELALAAWRDGVGDEPPDRAPWLRQLVITWHHSHDMHLILAALGAEKQLAGVHDLTETVKGRELRESLHRRDPAWVAAGLHRVDPWYRRWVESLDDEQDVVIGYLNPNLAASFFRRGLDPSGGANASAAHLLSDHHLGRPSCPVDMLEMSVNWVLHLLPREHHGIMQRPRASWLTLETLLASDPAAKASTLLCTIARDVSPLLQRLEQEGHITPWHLLRV